MALLASICLTAAPVAASLGLHATILVSAHGAKPQARAEPSSEAFIDIDIVDVPVPPTVREPDPARPEPEPQKNVALRDAAPPRAAAPVREAIHEVDRAPVEAPEATPAVAVAPEVVHVDTSGGPRFTIVVPPAPSVGATGLVGATSKVATIAPPLEAIVPESGVSTPAHLVSGATATYPAEARQAEIEATVPVEIVVDTSGSVVAARVVQQAGYGFDEAAMAAIKHYRFSVAQREGHPVRVRMRWSVQFRLR